MRYTSHRCYSLSRAAWQWSIASLPLDPLIYELGAGNRSSGWGQAADYSLLIFCALIAAAGTLRENAFDAISRFRRLQSRFSARQVNILIAALFLLAAGDIASHFISAGARAPIAATLPFAIFGIFAAMKSGKQIKAYSKRFIGNRAVQVEQANTLHLAVTLIPIAAARIFGLLSATQSQNYTEFSIGLVCTMILLLALHPAERDFMAPCPNCRRMTSRVLRSEQFCPACHPEKFVAEGASSG